MVTDMSNGGEGNGLFICLFSLADFRGIRNKHGWSAFSECVLPVRDSRFRDTLRSKRLVVEEEPNERKTAEHVVLDGIVASRSGK